MDAWTVSADDLGEVTPNATLRQAAQKMRVLDVAALPVCEAGEFVGVVTAQDIAVRGVADGIDPNTSHVRDVMTWQMFFFDGTGC